MSILKITGDGIRHTVELDGQDISSALRGVMLHYKAGEVPTAELEVLVVHGSDIEEHNARIVIPDATVELLLRLGWTPKQ